MLTVISPAKRLDWTERNLPATRPLFEKEAGRLAAHMRQKSLRDLRELMTLSDDLARLNRDRFQAFSESPEEDATRPALYAFAGDTYQGLDAASMDEVQRLRAQSHLRILSGLYGVLRPFDAIQPYRLEMGTKLRTRRGNTLYDFWRKDIAQALGEAAEAIGADTLINCASQEYFGAVDTRALGLKIVTPRFFEVNDKGPRIVSFFAKKARGSMARFILDHRLVDPDDLRAFDLGGYRYVGGDGVTLDFHRDVSAAEAAA